jgi:hypothetical protein
MSDSPSYAGGGLEGMLGQDKLISIIKSNPAPFASPSLSGNTTSGSLTNLKINSAHRATSSSVPETETMNGFTFGAVEVDSDEDEDAKSNFPDRLMRINMRM